jgi:hemerythrin HHE cation binding domain-containing protein
MACMRDIEQLAASRSHLVRACLDIIAHALEQPHTLAPRWVLLESALRAHMVAEETLILPVFQPSEPRDAVDRRAENVRIRELLDAIHDDVAAGSVDLQRLTRLSELVSMHLVREDAMYAWFVRHRALVAKRRATGWLRRKLGRHPSCLPATSGGVP